MVTGGDNISVTKGVVSRVEPTQYVHGATQLMAIQIDAAINPGNSGGPAIMGNKVAGVAFQNLSGAENIGLVFFWFRTSDRHLRFSQHYRTGFLLHSFTF